MSYQDELSVKLSAKDELSAKLKDVRRETTAVEKAMVAARREIENTGSPQAVAELKRLEGEYERLARSQRELSKTSSQVKRDLDQIKAKAAGTTSTLDRLGGAIVKRQKEIQRTGIVMAAAFAYFSKGALEKFSLVEDASSALSATFGQTGDDMIDWSKRTGDALNLSQAQALDALMTFSGYAKTAGLQGQQLASFSEQLVARSADLASYYGGTTADAIQALGAALRGEAEPARRYQIFVDDLALKQEYLALTGQKVTGTLTAQQKVLAASSLIMKQSSVAQGDLARTADSTANTLKDSAQQWEDFQSAMGETVAKGVTPLLQKGNVLLGVVTRLPRPVQQTALMVTGLGIAAMIATPRIIALSASIKSTGGALTALTKVGPWLALTAAVLLFEQGLEDVQARSEEIRRRVAALPKEAQDEYATASKHIRFSNEVWLKSTERRAAAESDAADTRTRAVAQAQRADLAEARALSRVAFGTRRVTAAHLAAAAAARVQSAAEDRLTGALNRAERMLARREAMRSYRQAMQDFVKKPSAEAGDAVSSAMLSVANTYANPERRAKFVKRSFEAIEKTVKGSGLPANIKKKVTSPLHDAYIEANRLLNTMRRIDSGIANSTSVGNAFDTPIRRAAGGLVTGPGTGTSDSIPALLSNREYVIRAGAVNALGVGLLDRLNHADRLPAKALAALPPMPALAAGRGPVPVSSSDTYQVTQHITANGQIDYEQGMRREFRRLERDKRTRLAGTR